MKKTLLSLSAVLLSGVVLNCSVAQDKNTALQRRWMMVSFNDFSKDQLAAHKAEINLTANRENGKMQGSAYMGCNRMSFISEFKKGGKIKFQKE